jgi:hypothetical protein
MPLLALQCGIADDAVSKRNRYRPNNFCNRFLWLDLRPYGVQVYRLKNGMACKKYAMKL